LSLVKSLLTTNPHQGTILGPVIGGAFADSKATWRWVSYFFLEIDSSANSFSKAFYINLVLIGIASPIFLFCIPSTQPQPNVSFTRKMAELDWLGALLNAGIYSAWVIGLQFGGSTWEWSSGRTIATFVVCGVLIIAFILQQYFSILTTPERRIFPVMFLTRRTMLVLFVVTAAVTSLVFVPIFYIPVYFEFVHGDSGVESAVRLLPLVMVLVFTTVVSGFALPKIGYYMPFFLVSGILGLTGSGMFFSF
jgi:hypothetical protein